MCKHTKFIFFRGDYKSDVCEDTHLKVIDANSRDELDAKVIKDDQSQLQSRKKRSFPTNEQRSFLRRDVKRYRFSSLFSSFNENTHIENEFDVSNYTLFKRRRSLKLHLVSTH